MKKIIWMGMVATVALCAYDAEVKSASVNLLINDQTKAFEKGEKFTLNFGDIVCFVDGEGRVVIESKTYKKQLSKRTKSCKQLPNEGGEKETVISKLKVGLIAKFSVSQEISQDGVSRKSIGETKTNTDPIIINEEVKYVTIEYSHGILPVTMEVIDDKNQIVESFINEEDMLTSFTLHKKIHEKLMKENYSVRVTDGLGDILLDSKMKFVQVKK